MIERAPVAQGWIVSGFSEGAGVGSGLASSGLGGSLLRRGIPLSDETRGPPGAKNTQLAELIPRFLRLSALVALELGREVGATPSAENIVTKVLVPTSEWYLLLAGLLTCAVLEGYLTAGWTGLAPVQVLLGVGLGSAVIPEPSQLTANDEYDEFEPDDMPDLPDAVSVLFPSWSAKNGPRYDIAGGASAGENFTGSGRRVSDPEVIGEGGEAEFSHEMGQRVARVCNCLLGTLLCSFSLTPLIGNFDGLLITGRSLILFVLPPRQFLDVPAGTPDLLMHMENLARRFPAEPVERAALRFCEAIALWRGKPELETVRPRHLPMILSFLPPFLHSLRFPKSERFSHTHISRTRSVRRHYTPHTPRRCPRRASRVARTPRCDGR